MEEFLAGPVFRYAVFPILSTLLGIGVKHVTRNDRYAKFRKEDLAVGIEILLTACLMFLALTSDRATNLVQANASLAAVLGRLPVDAQRATQLQANVNALSHSVAMAGWLIAFMFLGLWSVSSVVRIWGWKSETELHGRVGIALPLVLGVLALIAVMAGAR
ncbi:MAG: hypothetical protein QOI58_1237 [Thermoanaerobaculia bacterium]|jgi:hypothetical protein|nr:hypothetical protein [Thermoanaerobaculia bacterium]